MIALLGVASVISSSLCCSDMMVSACFESSSFDFIIFDYSAGIISIAEIMVVFFDSGSFNCATSDLSAETISIVFKPAFLSYISIESTFCLGAMDD